MISDVPILYSFRRCPYAMRARMALHYAEIETEHREVDFKNKPGHMLEISPKGTVPVLQLTDRTVLEESLDIMRWALNQNDPDGWLEGDIDLAGSLIFENDGAFKKALDRYKYPTRYPDENCSGARDQGEEFLEKLNDCLSNTKYLCADHLTVADIAIFPFIRQFANVDRQWFDALPLKPLQKWLADRLDSALFAAIMIKHDVYSGRAAG